MQGAPVSRSEGDGGAAPIVSGTSVASAEPSEAERRAARLAELVSGLTGCEKGGALHAVRDQHGGGDALEVVARAMVEVDAPPPERFRVAGFLRSEMLVEHRSLRRWDRLHDEHDRPEDQIVDLRFSQRKQTERLPPS